MSENTEAMLQMMEQGVAQLITFWSMVADCRPNAQRIMAEGREVLKLV
jgi:hypothetical protein